MTRVLPLELLKAGECGRICEVDGLQELVHRLAEMGLQEGAVVTMLQPGSPCILDLNHQRLSFRTDDQTTILIELPS